MTLLRLCCLQRIIPQRQFLLLTVQIFKKKSSKTPSPSPLPSGFSLISYSGSLDSPLGAYFSVNYLSPLRCSATTKGKVHEPRQNSSNRTTPLRLSRLPSLPRRCCFLSHSAHLYCSLICHVLASQISRLLRSPSMYLKHSRPACRKSSPRALPSRLPFPHRALARCFRSSSNRILLESGFSDVHNRSCSAHLHLRFSFDFLLEA